MALNENKLIIALRRFSVLATTLVVGFQALASTTPSSAQQAPVSVAHHLKKAAHRKTVTVGRVKSNAAHPPGIRNIRHQTPYANRLAVTGNDVEDFDARWGCVTSTGNKDLVRLLGLHDEGLSKQLALNSPDLQFSATPCIPYSVLVNESDQVLALAVAWYKHGDTNTRLDTYVRLERNGPITHQTKMLPELNGSFHIETVTLQQAIEQTESVAQIIPKELRFELAGVAAAIASSEEGNEHPQALIQVMYDDGIDGMPAHLDAVTLIDEQTGQNLGQALYLQRDNMPNGFFTTSGESLERQFWTNPVTFTHISRGVGPGSVRITLRSKVIKKVHKKTKVTEVRRTVLHRSNHIGVDFAAPKDTPVLAVADGKVVFAANYAGYGNLIILEHPGGYTTHYGHLNAFDENTVVGSDVHRGQVIGYVGSTGLSTGYHLHYEIRLNGAYLDPLDESVALALWSLRRDDYSALAQQILLSASSLTVVQTKRSTHFASSSNVE